LTSQRWKCGANRLVEIKKELSQMLNRPEDPRVWWEKGAGEIA